MSGSAGPYQSNPQLEEQILHILKEKPGIGVGGVGLNLRNITDFKNYTNEQIKPALEFLAQSDRLGTGTGATGGTVYYPKSQPTA